MRLQWLAIPALLLAPLASAGSAPVVGFLADSADGPAADGVLKLAIPDTNESKLRPITADLVGPTVFAGNESVRAGTHLRGPLFVGIWPDASAVYEGNLSVTVKVGEDTAFERSINVAADPESLPDPASLVPEDPTDPEGAVLHAIAQVLPAVMNPPLVYNFGSIDVEVPEGEDVVLELRLINADGTPPLGATTLIKYDGRLSPSFAYLPWWSADPEAESPQNPDVPSGGSGGSSSSSSSSGSAGGGGGGTDGSTSDAEEDGEDSPGIALLPAAGVLVAIAFVLRRRAN